MDAKPHFAPHQPLNRQIIMHGMELSLNGCTQLADVLVRFRQEAADLTDCPPQGESFEIQKAFLCNEKGQPAIDISSLLNDSWTEELVSQLKEGY